MLRAILISLAVLLAIPATAFADVTAADQKAIDAKVAVFFQTTNEGRTDAAFQNFMLPLASQQPELMAQLVGTMDQLRTIFEGPFQYDLIKSTTAGNRLVVREYIIFTDKLPYYVSVVMFRTSTGWYCQHVNMTDLKPEHIVDR